jgi:hypothetical protein
MMKSVKPDLAAQGELMEAMTDHLVSAHHKHASQLAKDMATLHMLLGTYLLIKHYVRIPAEEKALLQSFQDNEQSLIDLFGFQPQAID